MKSSIRIAICLSFLVLLVAVFGLSRAVRSATQSMTWGVPTHAQLGSNGGITSTAINQMTDAVSDQLLTSGQYWEITPNNVSGSPSSQFLINTVGHRDVYKRISFGGGYISFTSFDGSSWTWGDQANVTTSSVIRLSLDGTNLKVYIDGNPNPVYTYQNMGTSLEFRMSWWGTSSDYGCGLTSASFSQTTATPTPTPTPGTGVSAANVSFGQFGQNTGGGDYSFPANLTVSGNITSKFQDMAEWVPSSSQLPSGTVVILDPTQSNHVTASSVSYDTRVAGVISENPGISLGEAGVNKVLVATTGRVRVKVDTTRAPIHIGDLLVTSDIPGVAMKSEPVEFAGRKMHMPGTLIGKALEPLENGSGTILVLLSLQ